MSAELIGTLIGMAVCGLLSFAYTKYQCNQNTKDIERIEKVAEKHLERVERDLKDTKDKTESMEEKIFSLLDRLDRSLSDFKIKISDEVSDIRHFNTALVKLKAEELEKLGR